MTPCCPRRRLRPSHRERPPRGTAPAREPRPAPAPARAADVRRAVISAAVALAAVLLQVTVVNNVRWPGGSPPDLVLVAVIALALATGPLPGSVTGFGAGLALDIAPAASHLLGQDALVFCLLGYLCGRLREPLER